MKEFIEKLTGRLEEESKFAVSLLGGKTSSYIAGCCDTNKKTISIVNQLAEEYNNDFCEWTPMRGSLIGFVREPHRMYLFKDDKERRFCPYCGKKIKVLTEGSSQEE